MHSQLAQTFIKLGARLTAMGTRREDKAAWRATQNEAAAVRRAAHAQDKATRRQAQKIMTMADHHLGNKTQTVIGPYTVTNLIVNNGDGHCNLFSGKMTIHGQNKELLMSVGVSDGHSFSGWYGNARDMPDVCLAPGAWQADFMSRCYRTKPLDLSQPVAC